MGTCVSGGMGIWHNSYLWLLLEGEVDGEFWVVFGRSSHLGYCSILVARTAAGVLLSSVPLSKHLLRTSCIPNNLSSPGITRLRKSSLPLRSPQSSDTINSSHFLSTYMPDTVKYVTYILILSIVLLFTQWIISVKPVPCTVPWEWKEQGRWWNANVIAE